MSTSDLIKAGIGYTDSYPMRPDSAAMCYLIVISRDLEHSNNRQDIENLVKAYVNLSFLYSHIFYDYSSAYRYLMKARELAEENNLESLLAYIYGNLSVNLLTWGSLHTNEQKHSDKQESFGYLSKAIDIALRKEDWKVLFFSILNLSDFGMQDVPEGYDDIIGKYKSLPTDTMSHFSKASKLFSEGISEYRRGDYASAGDKFEEIENWYEDEWFGSFEFKSQLRLYRAYALQKLGKLNYADSLLTANLEAITENGSLSGIVWLRKALSNIYFTRGDTVKGRNNLLEYYMAKERLAQRGDIEGLDELKFNARIYEFEKDIQAMNEKAKTRRLWLIVITTIAIAAVTILTMALIYFRKRQQYVMELYKKTIERYGDFNIVEKQAALIDYKEEDGDDTTEEIESSTESTKEYIDNTPENSVGVNGAGERGKSTSKNSSIDILNAERADILYAAISQVIADKKTIFNPDFQMKTLCELVNSNSRYVSFVVGKYYKKTFKTLLVELRIAEACKILSDVEKSHTYTIEHIAQSVGFKSRAAFITAFKNITGLSPSEFRSAAEKYTPSNPE